MQAIKYHSEVGADGKVDLPPLDVARGTPVEVILLVSSDVVADFTPLLHASESSLSFWDNPIDDDAWNEARS